MKLQKNDPHEDLVKILRDRLSEQAIEQIGFSFATMADIMSRYLMEQKNYRSLPSNVLYAITQTKNLLFTIWLTFHRPEEVEGLIAGLYFSPYDPKKDEECEERFIFVVKTFYEMLQKEGKL